MKLMDRRNFLRLTAASGTMLSMPAIPQLMAQMHANVVSQSPVVSRDFSPDLEIELVARPADVSILEGNPTTVWRYEGRVLNGRKEGLDWLPGSWLPVIRVRNGQRLRVVFKNDLPEETIVHWHGLHMPQKMDGHPMYAIASGQTFVYEFTVDNRPGTYWFHPHPHQQTGYQVWNGLAGLFIVEENETSPLPAGDYERAWVLQDRRFDANNQLVYSTNHMQMMNGALGDRIMVNGQPEYVEQMAAASYRIRVLNGSNSRFYKLAWDDNRPVTLIGSDGGLLETPIEKPYVMLAPAERIELFVDFGSEAEGSERILRSLEFDGGMSMGMGGMGPGRMGMGGMGMGAMHGGSLPNGAAFDVARIRITSQKGPSVPLPDRLSTPDWPQLDEAVNRNNPRRINLQMGMGTLTLNSRSFDMQEVADEEKVRAGTTEIWEFVNNSGHMSMTHPMHVHNVQFRVLERQSDPARQALYATMQAGIVDEGLKDVVIVMPGETVRVLMRFNQHTGIYLYHCHILEHEDLGMMRNYEAVS